MRTFSLAVGFVLCSFFALAVNTPLRPPPTEISDYFPLTEKTKWVYKAGELDITVFVDSVSDEGAVLKTELDDKVAGTEMIRVTNEGVFRVKINDHEIDPPVMLLKFKKRGTVVDKDEKWQVDSKIQDQKVTFENVIRETTEKVTVPAGEFDAVVVEGEGKAAGEKMTIKTWFAPGRGIVKLVINRSGGETTLELKEFVEGEKKK